MAFGILAAYAVLRVIFASMRPRKAAAQVKAQTEAARTCNDQSLAVSYQLSVRISRRQRRFGVFRVSSAGFAVVLLLLALPLFEFPAGSAEDCAWERKGRRRLAQAAPVPVRRCGSGTGWSASVSSFLGGAAALFAVFWAPAVLEPFAQHDPARRALALIADHQYVVAGAVKKLRKHIARRPRAIRAKDPLIGVHSLHLDARVD